MTMTASGARTVVVGLHFGECPRWHDGALWFSDMHGHRVLRASPDGDVSTVAELLDDRPAGLGWLPDGGLLIVAMDSQRLLRVDEGGRLAEHADLSSAARGSLNDMVVAADGTAYVGDMGGWMFRDTPVPWSQGQLIRVAPDGDVFCAAENLLAPNGSILTEDSKTLLVGESRASRITAFDVGSDGELANRRIFAEITPSDGKEMAPPDGICLDREGAVWVAEIFGRRLLRVLQGGTIDAAVQFENSVPIACVLGGRDRTTLFVCVAPSIDHHQVEVDATGRIDAFQVAIPGSGRP
jgi:sugar lactone lactonase YvrE